MNTVYTVTVNEYGTFWKNQNDEFHCEDGPAIERADGYTAWYINGKPHREDGPAVEDADGYKAWYVNGKRHREDGPAVEDADGDKYWYLNDIEYSEEEFNEKMNPVQTIVVNGKMYKLVE